MLHKFKKPMTIILTGAIIALLGGIVTALGTYLYNRDSAISSEIMEEEITESVEVSKNTNQEIFTLKSQNIELKDKSNELSVQIDELRKENSDLNYKLAKASKDIYEYVKGGEDAPFIKIYSFKQNECLPVLVNSNNNPIYSVFIEISNYDELIKCKYIKEDEEIIMDHSCFIKWSSNLTINELAVGEYYLDKSTFASMNKKEIGRYQIRYKLRNHTYYQQLVIKKIDGIIHTASRIYLLKNNKFICIATYECERNGINIEVEKEFNLGLIKKLKTL